MSKIFTPEAEAIRNRATQIVQEFNHRYFTSEHMLLALLEDRQIRSIIGVLEKDPHQISSELKVIIEKQVEKLNPDIGQKPSVACEKLITLAVNHARRAGRPLASHLDLFVALFFLEESWSKYVLSKHGVSLESVVDIIENSKEPAISTANEEPQSKDVDFLVDLNQKAIAGKIDPIIGREDELERIAQILCRRRKNNPILIGDPGVGKTALAEGLALKILHDDVPTNLKEFTVYSLDVGSLLAGTKFRGDFEERMKKVFKILKDNPKSILFIDEIHTIIGSGATSNNTLDIANILKPMLSSGELKCIGSTTRKEYNNIFEKDAALSRRFQKVDIAEPSIEDTLNILKSLKKPLEEHHQVSYSEESLRAATELSAKHINDRCLPDKAIDVLDEAGAAIHSQKGTEVTVAMIEKIISQMAKIPEKTVSADSTTKLKGLYKYLKSKIFGQEEALATIISSIELSSSGLRSEEKPIGNFLFCGPTGVGKTELCKQLSSYLGIPLIRFDMSEYMEKHSVSKLIGAPPGYVGYDQNGLLTEAVKKNPHSIVLLDEVEKAHPDILNLMLQVMDHGSLTDSNGRVTSFKHTIVVMTSNVGASDMSKRSLGFADNSGKNQNKPTSAVETTFSPEFRNRLDSVVYFNALSKENIADVLSKNLNELNTLLLQKKVTIHYSPEVKIN
jgi:ATP-dependent Clp protease ATP-binding subunit ClpA